MPVTNPDTLEGASVFDTDGDSIGKVRAVYTETDNGQPAWIAVGTGLFGNKETLIPLASASQTDRGVSVPYDKATIKAAPHSDPDAELSESDESDLYRHYGIAGGGTTTTGTTGTTTGTTGAAGAGEFAGSTATGAGHDTSGPNTDDAMTRSEEQVRVGTQVVETGRARLRKYVTTEQVTQTVPVTHEEVRVEREPITEANRGAAYDGPDISEEEHEVTLHGERPVVAKEAVPVERVRLATETVTGEAEVSESVRKEHIDTDGVTETPRGA